ncbi:MAG: hypothetical protein H6P96_1360 [Candidatus Aminicenantes bacterium]|jgi:hypothetical protein|nr:hypothetical protein [Candidatus Aminicenantes bacterium]
MRTSAAKEEHIMARGVRFDRDMMHVQLEDGRIVGVPLCWFPRLQKATLAERENWRLIGDGIGIHWPDLDEDVSVPALLK